MKKILSLCLIICFVFMTIPVFAAEYDWPIKSRMFTANTADDSVITAGARIFGIKCIGTTDAAQVAIYDCTSVQTATTTTIVDEDGAASQYDSSFSPLPGPIKLSVGGTILVSNAYALVFYRN